MRNPWRLSITTFALALLAACSSSSEEPALSDDLKQDLAKAGGSDVLLAGATAPKLDVVSAGERTPSPAPAPRATSESRAPSASRGTGAVVRRIRRERPAAAQPATGAKEVAPAEVPVIERAPEPAPSAAGRPQAPRPSTQREPPGGWSSPGRVIRNAPFPINP